MASTAFCGKNPHTCNTQCYQCNVTSGQFKLLGMFKLFKQFKQFRTLGVHLVFQNAHQLMLTVPKSILIDSAPLEATERF